MIVVAAILTAMLDLEWRRDLPKPAERAFAIGLIWVAGLGVEAMIIGFGRAIISIFN